MMRTCLLSFLFSLSAIAPTPKQSPEPQFKLSPLRGIDFVLRNSPTSRK